MIADGYLLHPLGTCAGTAKQVMECRGYNAWSGIISDLGEVTLIGGMVTVVATMLRRHNCHHKGCPFLAWHPDPRTGHPLCRRHHPDPHGYLKKEDA